jgi:hypothetical protein
MGDGQWALGNGQWAMGTGHWALGDGQWALAAVVRWLSLVNPMTSQVISAMASFTLLLDIAK